MGYHGGAPPWVYKNQMASQAASYDSQVRRREQRISELEKANSELRERVAQLERENRELRERQGLGMSPVS